MQQKQLFFFSFSKAIFAVTSYSFALLIALSLLSGFMQSIGIFLLFPLLEAAHVLPEQGQVNTITASVSSLFTLFGVQNSLSLILCIFAGLIILRQLCTRWHSILAPKVELQFVNQLRKQLFEAIVNSDWLFFCTHKPAHFTQVLSTELNRVGLGVADVNRLISSTLLLLFYSITALLINWQITAFVATAGLFAVFFQQRSTQRIYALGSKHSEQDKNLYHNIHESLSNLKLIKSSANEQRIKDNFDQVVDNNAELYQQSRRHHADVSFLFHLYSTLLLVLFIYLSVTWLLLPASSLLILVFVFSRMMPLISAIWMHFNHLTHMQAGYENYLHTYQQCLQHQAVKAVPQQQQFTLQQSITIDNLSFSYPGNLDSKVLQAINLHIPARQVTALTGLSGAGKTTLCDLIAGLYQPLTGSIHIDNTALTEISCAQWHKQVIYLTQDALLFDDSIRNNLCWYTSDAADLTLLAALEAAQLMDWFKQLPAGLDTHIGHRGLRLSGGEQQRLVLARAILAKPALLILDEASSAMDIINEQKIWQVIKQFCAHSTVLVIAHRMSSIQQADQVVVLNQGKVIEQGNWKKLSMQEQGYLQTLLQFSSQEQRS